MPQRTLVVPVARVNAGQGGGATAAALILLALAGPPARAGDVTVSVANVRGDMGHVRVALCTQATFLKDDCAYNASAPARRGETVVNVTGVEPGHYAAQVFYDDTDAGKVHQNVLGIPREGVGFSNDARLHLRGPRFRDAAFPVAEGGAQIRLKLRYLSASDRERARREPDTPQ
jgi:uncharacterized protein (DUF2141 family)